MKENYLAKWLNNELSEAELEAFKKTAEYADYQRIVATTDTLEAPDFDMDAALQEFKNKQFQKQPKVIAMKPRRKWLQIAAAIAVLMVVSLFYVNSLDTSISTEFAERREVTLPDASEVVLNADSRLSFSEKAWDKERNVTLKGEAFFKVAKGKRFTVATEAGTVSVLGTEFNVENRNDFFEVTCYEGLVSVNFNGKEIQLPAGSSFQVIQGTIQPITDPKTASPSWINHESSFNSIPLAYVLDEFQRQYNVRMEIQNVNTQQLFTGSFSNTNMDLALQSISIPSQIAYKLEGDKVLFYAKETP